MEAKRPKQKRTVRKTPKESSSPIPCGPTGGSMEDMSSRCGHYGCTGGTCNVRYVGPTTHMRDHHIVHAARGASNVWTAAIVAGLAVVLTGAIAYTALGADYHQPVVKDMSGEFRLINQRLDRLEDILGKLMAKQQESAAAPVADESCLISCSDATLGCFDTAGDDVPARQECLATDRLCRAACK